MEKQRITRDLGVRSRLELHIGDFLDMQLYRLSHVVGPPNTIRIQRGFAGVFGPQLGEFRLCGPL